MNLKFNFSEKRFIITGTTSGIGQKISLALAGAGAELLAIGRRAERLKELKDKFPDKISIAAIDVNNFADLKNAIEDYAAIKKVNGTVHAAGVNKFTPLRAFNWNDADSIIKTSAYAGIELIKLASSKKVGEVGSSHVLLASVAGIKGEVGFTAYSAAKSAVIGAMRSMALELAVKDMRVNAITPGWLPTEMTDSIEARYPGKIDTIKLQHPLGIGSVEDIANLVMFLLSDEARWITGSNIVIDGGYSIR